MMVKKVIRRAGALSLVVGIVTLVGGVVSGILLVVNGAKLLKKAAGELL